MTSLDHLVGLYLDPAALTTALEPVCVVGTAAGFYEVRRTPTGTVAVPRPTVPELSPPPPPLQLAIPRAPWSVFATILAWFRAILPYEGLVDVYWDAASGAWRCWVPPQLATPARVTVTDIQPPDPTWIRLVQIHSHGHFPARFSSTDDADEQAAGCYGLVSWTDPDAPTWRFRIACGGRFAPIPLASLFIPPWEQRVPFSTTAWRQAPSEVTAHDAAPAGATVAIATEHPD